MPDRDNFLAGTDGSGGSAPGPRRSYPAVLAAGATVTLAAAMTPLLLAATASAKTPVPNPVIPTIPVPNTPEFTSVDPGRGVVWMSGPTQAVELRESTHKIIRTVDLEAYPIAQTIDPV